MTDGHAFGCLTPAGIGSFDRRLYDEHETPLVDGWFSMPDSVMLVLSRRLSEIRRHRGLSQEDMAHAAGVSLTAYRALEQFPRAGVTTSNPSIATLMGVMRALEGEEALLRAVDAALASLLDTSHE